MRYVVKIENEDRNRIRNLLKAAESRGYAVSWCVYEHVKNFFAKGLVVSDAEERVTYYSNLNVVYWKEDYKNCGCTLNEMEKFLGINKAFTVQTDNQSIIMFLLNMAEENGYRGVNATREVCKDRIAYTEYGVLSGVAFVYKSNKGNVTDSQYDNNYLGDVVTIEEAVRRLQNTTKPISIGSDIVVFNDDGSIKVGCTKVDFKTIEEIYEEAKKTKE